MLKPTSNGVKFGVSVPNDKVIVMTFKVQTVVLFHNRPLTNLNKSNTLEKIKSDEVDEQIHDVIHKKLYYTIYINCSTQNRTRVICE